MVAGDFFVGFLLCERSVERRFRGQRIFPVDEGENFTEPMKKWLRSMMIVSATIIQ